MKHTLYVVVCVRERELSVLNITPSHEEARKVLLDEFAETVDVAAEEVLKWESAVATSDECDYTCGYTPDSAWANDIRHDNYDWKIIEVPFTVSIPMEITADVETEDWE